MAKFKQFNIDEPRDGLPLEKINGQWTLTDDIYSRNYVRGKRGISLTATDDNRAQLPFGGKNFSSNTGGGKKIIVNPGESIQAAIDELKAIGGGKVEIANGIHNVYRNIILYSNIYIEGQNSESAIVDFNNTASGFIISGSNAYTTGTISVTNGSTTVTGSGTTFTADMVGRSILLGNLWYPIAAYVSATELTLAAGYAGENLSGVTYVIANIIKDVFIGNLLIKRTLANGIKVQYGEEIFHDNLNMLQNAVCFDIDDVSNFSLERSDISFNAYGLLANNMHFAEIRSSGSINTTTGDGISLTKCSSTGFNTVFIQDSAANGVSLTNCKDVLLNGVNSIKNTGKGIELVSDNTEIIMIGCGVRANGSDGIKLTTNNDRCVVSSSVIPDNGGYGINLSASTNDNNVVKSNVYNNNTSGAVQDLGTNTNSSTY